MYFLSNKIIVNVLLYFLSKKNKQSQKNMLKYQNTISFIFQVYILQWLTLCLLKCLSSSCPPFPDVPLFLLPLFPFGPLFSCCLPFPAVPLLLHAAPSLLFLPPLFPAASFSCLSSFPAIPPSFWPSIFSCCLPFPVVPLYCMLRLIPSWFSPFPAAPLSCCPHFLLILFSCCPSFPAVPLSCCPSFPAAPLSFWPSFFPAASLFLLSLFYCMLRLLSYCPLFLLLSFFCRPSFLLSPFSCLSTFPAAPLLLTCPITWALPVLSCQTCTRRTGSVFMRWPTRCRSPRPAHPVLKRPSPLRCLRPWVSTEYPIEHISPHLALSLPLSEYPWCNHNFSWVTLGEYPKIPSSQLCLHPWMSILRQPSVQYCLLPLGEYLGTSSHP